MYHDLRTGQCRVTGNESCTVGGGGGSVALTQLMHFWILGNGDMYFVRGKIIVCRSVVLVKRETEKNCVKRLTRHAMWDKRGNDGAR